MTRREEKEIIDRLRDESIGLHIPELPDKNLRIEAPKIEHELEMIRKELHQIKVVLKMGLKVCEEDEEDGGDTE